MGKYFIPIAFILLLFCGKGNEVKVEKVTQNYYKGGTELEYMAYKDSAGNYIRHGKYITWHRNGQKRSETFFVHDSQDQNETGWYENGKKRYECLWKNGRQVGPVMWLDEAGKVIPEQEMTWEEAANEFSSFRYIREKILARSQGMAKIVASVGKCKLIDQNLIAGLLKNISQIDTLRYVKNIFSTYKMIDMDYAAFIPLAEKCKSSVVNELTNEDRMMESFYQSGIVSELKRYNEEIDAYHNKKIVADRLHAKWCPAFF